MVTQLAEQKFKVLSLVFRCGTIFAGVSREAVVLLVRVPGGAGLEKLFHVGRPFVEKFEGEFKLVERRQRLTVLQSPWWGHFKIGHVFGTGR